MTKPAISFFNTIGTCPTELSSVLVCVTTSGAVNGAGAISTAGTR
jgi:hypothetical protein